jgi:hypothetical protein
MTHGGFFDMDIDTDTDMILMTGMDMDTGAMLPYSVLLVQR